MCFPLLRFAFIRTANAILTGVFHRLRDCDAALHRCSGVSKADMRSGYVAIRWLGTDFDQLRFITDNFSAPNS